MDSATAALAILPPALAITVERLNPIDEVALRKSAEQAFKSYEETTDHVDLVDDISKFSAGAVEVTALAPTIIASPRALLALFANMTPIGPPQCSPTSSFSLF